MCAGLMMLDPALDRVGFNIPEQAKMGWERIAENGAVRGIFRWGEGSLGCESGPVGVRKAVARQA